MMPDGGQMRNGAQAVIDGAEMRDNHQMHQDDQARTAAGFMNVLGRSS
jgi:hypothetical protein